MSINKVIFIVGGSQLDPESRTKIDHLSTKFQDRFLFLGYLSRQKTVELTQASHIGFYLVHPETSYWVRYSPNKVYEYLICGTIPIIRADVDHGDVISECGLIFNRDDSDDIVMKGITDLINHPEMMKDFMERARVLSVNYSWESVAGRYIGLYNSLLGQI
jgi:glycosyltransferase involved in cell wall biosynthesis